MTKNNKFCEEVTSIPEGYSRRKWTLRIDNSSHYHGVVPLSESPFYLELHCRKNSDSNASLVGFFRLDLNGLLSQEYIRHEPVKSYSSDVRIRIVYKSDGCFYLQSKLGQLALLMKASNV